MERVKDEPVAELVKEELGWIEKPAEPFAAPERDCCAWIVRVFGCRIAAESLRRREGCGSPW